jgi:alkaline phosphatase D
VRWEVARDPGFRHVVARGNERTSADSDHTLKVDVTGLAPYTRLSTASGPVGARSDQPA